MNRILKIKPLLSSLESSSGHNFLQRCSVSGTPKGKAKTKTAAPLKRSKITTKKGAADAAARSGGGKRYAEKEKFYEQCLNAPTPVRYVTEKERQREAEREKLGLISKERQREIDMKKKKKPEFQISETPTEIGPPGLDLIALGLVDEEKLPKYELIAEDGKRLAKEYSRVLMRQHRARQAAESALLQLKKEAIEALPEHLKAAASVPDMTPFPTDRFMATLTPPIDGYIENVKDAAKRSSAQGKLR